MRSKLLLIGIIGFTSCIIPKPPVPTPTPPIDKCEGVTCNSNQSCVEGECICNDCLKDVPWCGDVGQQCSTKEKPCKHNPTSDPCHCELAPDCYVPPVTCTNIECPSGTHCIETPNGPKCVPDTPGVNLCPKALAPGAYVYMNNKKYGNGFDSTVRVHGDTEFCRLIHGVPNNDCHLEGWPKKAECEYFLLDNNCPVWEYTVDGKTVYNCSDNQSALASCDHFGNPTYRDDPKTPTTGDTLATLSGFEGEPKFCGLHRDAYGPYQGFFTIAHGKASVRACVSHSSPNTCGPWQKFDH